LRVDRHGQRELSLRQQQTSLRQRELSLRQQQTSLRQRELSLR
jgi:hypothetical protein